MEVNTNEVILGYWSIRGYGEACRLLMEYTGLKYKQRKYTTYVEWLGDKNTIGFDIPNLPYLIDGTKKLTESDAIATYICIKSGRKDLLGNTEDEVVNLAMVRGVVYECRQNLISCVYNPDYQKLLSDILEQKIRPKFEQLDKFSEANGGKGLIGTQITYIDFIFYELAQQLIAIDEKFLVNCPTLTKLVGSISEDPNIQAYLKSDRFQARPFNGSRAYNPKQSQII